jgi:hypothetical protein
MMDALAVIQTVSVAQAVEGLRYKIAPWPSVALELLNQLRVIISCAKILADEELFPDREAEKLPAGWSDTDSNWMRDYLVGTLQCIDGIAPLDTDYLDVLIGEDQELPYNLPPGPEGYAMSLDEWDSITQDLSDYTDRNMQIFFWALAMNDGETLVRASEEWDWDLKRYPNFSKVTGLNHERFQALLTENNLLHFFNAFKACTYQTGNIYFDYNPYDEEAGYGTLPDITPEGVRYLSRQYQASKPIKADVMMAEEEFSNDADLVAKLMDIYIAALEFDSSVRPQTLAEMWAQDAAETDVTENEEADGYIDDDYYDE